MRQKHEISEFRQCWLGEESRPTKAYLLHLLTQQQCDGRKQLDPRKRRLLHIEDQGLLSHHPRLRKVLHHSRGEWTFLVPAGGRQQVHSLPEMFRSRSGQACRGPVLLEACYYYQYIASNGRLVRITQGDRFELLHRSNQDWWQVRRQGQPKKERPIFVPAAYVVELPEISTAAKRGSLPGRLWQGSAVWTGASPVQGNEDNFPGQFRTLEGQPASGSEEAGVSRPLFLPPNPHPLFVGNVSALVQSWPPKKQGGTEGKAILPGDTNIALERQSPPDSANPTSPVYSNLQELKSGSTAPPSPTAPPVQVLDLWERHLDPASGRSFYINSITKETTWKPPRQTKHRAVLRSVSTSQRPSSAASPPFLRRSSAQRPLKEVTHQRTLSQHSLTPPSPMMEKAGPLKKTKIAEGGRKLKKNWSNSWVVLAGNSLAFYKETKAQSPSVKSDHPESSMDLRGCLIEWTKEMSSRKHVFRLRTITGNEFLLHAENEDYISDWYKTIKKVIETLDRENPLDFPLVHALRRTASAELLECSGDEEQGEAQDMQSLSRRTSLRRMGSDNTERKRVKNRIRKFITRRPPLQTLQEKGLIKDQVFGCRLDALCEREKTTVPKFVQLCIETVEKRGLDTDGVYRVSGNLAVIQKLRFIVDHERVVTSDGRYLFPEERYQEEKLNLDDPEWEDIHVVTGALKMFLRELPEPLFPFEAYEEFISCVKNIDHSQRLGNIKRLVDNLPQSNRDTMETLFRHFQKVLQHTGTNRMTAQGLGIVFGPTLLRSESDALTLPFLMVYQNQVVELVLLECEAIFGEARKLS
ncbi:rho GTPase-activating protein 15 isoform X2 [Narcine bancroftii]|uniref:rho GTPase-activating protein 15 isoform X2 n=1 Tax=Narcine bancroftii TaxID=1343680 RepID=UPI003831662A